MWLNIGEKVGKGIKIRIEEVKVDKMKEMEEKKKKKEEGLKIEEMRKREVKEEKREKGVMRVRGEEIKKLVEEIEE